MRSSPRLQRAAPTSSLQTRFSSALPQRSQALRSPTPTAQLPTVAKTTAAPAGCRPWTEMSCWSLRGTLQQLRHGLQTVTRESGSLVPARTRCRGAGSGAGSAAESEAAIATPAGAPGAWTLACACAMPRKSTPTSALRSATSRDSPRVPRRRRATGPRGSGSRDLRSSREVGWKALRGRRRACGEGSNIL
eukprot:3321897-Rhodomonas_salina.2